MSKTTARPRGERHFVVWFYVHQGTKRRRMFLDVWAQTPELARNGAAAKVAERGFPDFEHIETKAASS